MKKFIDLNRGGQQTEYARCLKARYNAGITNYKGDNSGVIELENPMEDGTSRTLKAQYQQSSAANFIRQDGLGATGVRETIKVKDGTSKGYAECEVGGVLDMAFPDSETRRGRVQDNGNTVGTLDTGSQHGLVEGKYRIRKLTPKECFRLQGWNFDGKDTYFERAAMVNSDSQLYKQAGNGVSVNVIEVIAKSLSEEEDA